MTLLAMMIMGVITDGDFMISWNSIHLIAGYFIGSLTVLFFHADIVSVLLLTLILFCSYWYMDEKEEPLLRKKVHAR